MKHLVLWSAVAFVAGYVVNNIVQSGISGAFETPGAGSWFKTS